MKSLKKFANFYERKWKWINTLYNKSAKSQAYPFGANTLEIITKVRQFQWNRVEKKK